MVSVSDDSGHAESRRGWSFYRWMVRTISDPGFQDRAVANRLLRPLARRNAHGLYDLVAGFVYSQTLLALVDLDIPGMLAERPLDAAAIAPRAGLSTDATRRLLQAGAAIGVLRRDRRGRYRLSQIGAALLGAPGVVEMVRHHRDFYADISDPVALLRGEAETVMSRYWGYVGGASTHDIPADIARRYSDLMAVSQTMVAAETISAYPFARHAALLDVGGGAGAFASAVLAATPTIRATVFDLPPVAAQAEERFAREGLSGRASAQGGSFLDDSLPRGADLITLIRVCYDHDDDVVLALLRKVRDALPPGGTLVISEPMSGGERPDRVGDAYFGFYTAAMGTGRPRSVAEHGSLLEAAGFSGVRAYPVRQPFITGVVSARVAD
ncbi:MAG: methyltransferase [Rubricella sp.]